MVHFTWLLLRNFKQITSDGHVVNNRVPYDSSRKLQIQYTGIIAM